MIEPVERVDRRGRDPVRVCVRRERKPVLIRPRNVLLSEGLGRERRDAVRGGREERRPGDFAPPRRVVDLVAQQAAVEAVAGACAVEDLLDEDLEAPAELGAVTELLPPLDGGEDAGHASGCPGVAS